MLLKLFLAAAFWALSFLMVAAVPAVNDTTTAQGAANALPETGVDEKLGGPIKAKICFQDNECFPKKVSGTRPFQKVLKIWT